MLHKHENACLPYPLSIYHDKRKGELTLSSSLRLSDTTAPEQCSKGMDALQANHERPTNSYEEAHPFSSVHPHGPPCESRAEAPGPSCLQSIAWHRGSDGGRKCGNVGFAGRRLAALANYSLKQCSKLFFFLLPLPLALSRLLQWRLLLRAAMQASTEGMVMASHGRRWPMDALWTLMQ